MKLGPAPPVPGYPSRSLGVDPKARYDLDIGGGCNTHHSRSLAGLKTSAFYARLQSTSLRRGGLWNRSDSGWMIAWLDMEDIKHLRFISLIHRRDVRGIHTPTIVPRYRGFKRAD